MDGGKTSIQDHGYDYTRCVLKVIIKSSDGPTSLGKVSTNGQVYPKHLRAAVKAALVYGFHRYRALYERSKEHPLDHWN